MTKPWKLVADIGGTNARLGIMVENDFNQFYRQDYPVSQYEDFNAVINAFMKEVAEYDQLENLPEQCCLAVATQVEGDMVSFTNSHWSFSKAALAATLENRPLQNH